MNKDNNLFPFPIIFIVVSYILIVSIFGSVSDTLLLVLVIATGVGVFVGILKYNVGKRDRIRPVIVEIINNFIIPTITDLGVDKFNSRRFNFPDSLNLEFGIPTNNDIFKRFSRRNHFLTWKISRYNNFCSKINRKIGSLKANAYLSRIIEEIVDAEGVHPILVEQYEDYSKEHLNELLKQNDLTEIVKGIEDLQKKLPDKVDRLLSKLRKLRENWREKYNIV